MSSLEADMAIAAAVLAGGAMIAYVLYNDTTTTFGGAEVDKLNAYLNEDCQDVLYDNTEISDRSWHKQTSAGAENYQAVVQFEEDMVGAAYNRNNVTKYFIYPHGIGGWIRQEVDSKEAEWKEESDNARESQKDTSMGAMIGGAVAGVLTGGLGAIPGALLGGLIGNKVASNDENKIVSLQQPSLSPDQIAALNKMQAAIIAKQAECQKEAVVWQKEWDDDFMNMIRFMAQRISQNAPTIITHAEADTYWAKNQVTLPPQMVAAQQKDVYGYIDVINANYAPIPNVNISPDEMQKVSAVVSAYVSANPHNVNDSFYQMIMWIPGVADYCDTPRADFTASCAHVLIAAKNAGLSDQGTLLALAPLYYLTRVCGFRGAGNGLPSGHWQDPGQAFGDVFTAPTLQQAQKQAYNEILSGAKRDIAAYYAANPTSGPVYTQDNCRYWFIQIGLDKAGINSGGAAMWEYMRPYVPSLPPWQPAQ